jgi:prepilin-type N-terminal cleavage/methylation domain-containing protein
MTGPNGTGARRSFRPTAERDARAGFSLMEMMVVLMIVGLGMAMVVPRINVTQQRAESAVQSVASTLMVAQRAAVSRQHDVIVAFETDQQRVRIHFDIDNDGVMDAGEAVRREPLGNAVIFGRSGTAPTITQIGAGPVSFTGRQGGMPMVIFGRGGNASEEGGLYITTASGTSPTAYTSRAVLVDRATGRASVFRYTQSGWQRRF